MGPAEVAAWGIVGFLWDTFEYFTGEKLVRLEIGVMSQTSHAE